ncbi:unnamed protein product [Allacma fusca]|uniref:PCI domain-containing protein n=1 Tax=Allacma fusca TaxID=39272 RepID=A0A8J2JQ63_9HEXA|nr:unnamed protein product [Allacma fusca]
MPGSDYNPVEPMQVDLPPEENDNTEEETFIVENPTLDLDSYINNYSGMARLLRLLHIADHCPPLRIEALKMAINHVQNTFNVPMYQQLHKKLRDAIATVPLPDVTGGNGPTAADLPQLDLQWIEQKSKKASLKLEKLDGDLKNYKSNSIKESIRRGHDDLAEHYLDAGDLTNALKCFSRARDYCTSAKHVINMCLNVIKVSIYLQNWTHVLNFVAKAENTPDAMEVGKTGSGSGAASAKESGVYIATKLRCAAGLAELAGKKYKQAAKCFLQANFDHCDFSDMISPNNVAIYGGLCALATFDREELQKNVISSNSFKLFLELEPQVRDVIFKFYESKYATCLRLLDDMRDNLLLDMYLAPHVRTLYAQIRSRGLIQYFSPYASADLNRMADSFNTTVSALENELMQLILDGQIQARIDSHNKILFSKNVDQRSVTFEKSLRMGEEYERKTKLMILRAAMIRAQIQVKNPQRENQNETPGNSNARGHRD